jgi:hypothetical protein
MGSSNKIFGNRKNAATPMHIECAVSPFSMIRALVGQEAPAQGGPTFLFLFFFSKIHRHRDPGTGSDAGRCGMRCSFSESHVSAEGA